MLSLQILLNEFENDWKGKWTSRNNVLFISVKFCIGCSSLSLNKTVSHFALPHLIFLIYSSQASDFLNKFFQQHSLLT